MRGHTRTGSGIAPEISCIKPRCAALALWIAGLLAVLLVGPTPARAADPVIAAAGDIACDPATSTVFNNGLGTATGCHQKYTSDLFMTSSGTLRADLAAVLALGDIQYEDGRYFKYVGCPPAPCASPPVPASYEAKDAAGNPISWGRAKSITRPVPGNHDYGANSGNYDPNASGYFTYFADALSQFGAAAGDPRQGYYSFDVPVASGASWHLVAINSECAAGLAPQVGWSGGCDAGSAQERWLRNDLANHPSDCTLAYWHHPLFSSGGIGNNVVMKPIWQALYDGYADIVLNGHDHNYERFAPQDPNGNAAPGRGIREFVVGTGGKSLLALGELKPNSERLDKSSWGILELTLHGADSAHSNGWYEWQFRPDGNSGTFTDSGSADCVQPAPPSASFTLSATPPSQSVARGGSVDYTVEVTPANGFIGSVNLSVSGLPPRSTASFNPNPTESSSNSSTLTITTSNKTKRGTFTLTIKGMSGSMASDATVELTVSP
jgi:hypothetical protein